MLKPRKKRNKETRDRLQYLSLLVIELQEVKSRDAEKQVLANLANFAYDPYNYNYFRQLSVVDIFLNYLSDVDEILVQFAISGICNLSLDPRNKEHILKNDGVKIIMKLLEHENENVLLSAITTLMFLVTPESKNEITGTDIVKCIIKLTRGKNNRIKNVAEIFLQDYCSEQQIEVAQKLLDSSVQDIPLPDS